ncbi:MAG TPA: AAA family ATPase [Candidatus Nanoarchaeia archaeon]|nr:AAA family ATPase [Candidatus Nanoarchaeia archaeon]
MVLTGSQELDKFLKEYKNVTLIYGPAGSGKSTLCLLAAIEQALNNKKVLFLDTEINFSVERFQQLLNNRNKECINNILKLKIQNFNYQHKYIQNLQEIKNISLIIVDSITHHYRRLQTREPELAKAMLGKQLKILKEISKNNIPIIVTSQVYSDMNKNILPVANTVLTTFSDKIIKLEKEPGRKIKIIEPDKKEIKFDIINEGIKLL